MSISETALAIAQQLMEASQPGYPAWNMEQRLSGAQPSWNYIDGCMLKALLDLEEVQGGGRYLAFVEDYLAYFISPEGEIRHYSAEEQNCDRINGGKVLLRLYEAGRGERYRLAAQALYAQLEKQPRLSCGNFWHKRIYPNQIWLDGLYMVQPFFLQYQRLFCQYQNYQDSIGQFRRVEELLRDPETGLYYHAYDESRSMFWADPKTGLSPNFWGRSLGWFAMALIDSLEQLSPKLYSEYACLRRIFTNLAAALAQQLDPETGLLYQLPQLADYPGNYLETSASAALAYVFYKGRRMGLLPARYARMAERCYRSILDTKLRREDDGAYHLHDICLVAGLGGDSGKGSYKRRDGSPEYYLSEPRVPDDAKGVAAFLFASAERARLEARGLCPI